MKVVFSDTVPSEPSTYFGIYHHASGIIKHPLFIDVREVVRKHAWEWLEELHVSYAAMARTFLHRTRWWWTTFMSRLDARPWCQEPILKPLFFARAVAGWIRDHPDAESLMLVGCDPLVPVYLEEFKKDLAFQNRPWRFPRVQLIRRSFRDCTRAVQKMGRTLYLLIRYHLFRDALPIQGDIIVLHELVPHYTGLSYRYYFTGLFDSDDVSDQRPAFVCATCLTPDLAPGRADVQVNNHTGAFLLDAIRLRDLITAVGSNIKVILTAVLLSLKTHRASLQGMISKRFWSQYLMHELGRVPCLTELCAYRAFTSILRKGKHRIVIYPYEEKGLERAILFACNENGVKTIGYCPHPQHRLALSLRENVLPISPKPTQYAVCGTAYVDYFHSWCRKHSGSIHVWGSEKSMVRPFQPKKLNRSNLSVLLLISHPNELEVFYSWLKSEPRLSDSIQYRIRVHKAGGDHVYKDILSHLQGDFPFAKESQGGLEDDMARCSIAVFCATSAGPQAVNLGYLAVFTDLNDFFEINPCFDSLTTMMPCYSPAELVRRLDEICSRSHEELIDIHQRQVSTVRTIFSPMNGKLLREDIRCLLKQVTAG